MVEQNFRNIYFTYMVNRQKLGFFSAIYDLKLSSISEKISDSNDSFQLSWNLKKSGRL